MISWEAAVGLREEGLVLGVVVAMVVEVDGVAG